MRKSRRKRVCTLRKEFVDGRKPEKAEPRPGFHTLLQHKRISVGDVAAEARPTVLRTLLGSCVAVCLRDPLSGVGGMNHILLPEGMKEVGDARFGVHAMELLINEMMKLGADRRRFVAKAFGAGNVLDCLLAPTVGDLNAQFVRRFLAREGIPLIAERLGGKHAVEVSFRTDTGAAIVRSLDGSPLSVILARENAYMGRPVTPWSEDQITYF